VDLNERQLFGLRIRQLRAEAGLTQDELAERAGIFRTYMSRVETGEANPTLTIVHALAGALGVEVQRLFDPVDTAVQPGRTRSRQFASRGRAEKR
jgi:transcriptional regulator with XRE-family HTH domain